MPQRHLPSLESYRKESGYKMKHAFQIDYSDNVATALEQLDAGTVNLLGDCRMESITAKEEIPRGHKIAVEDIFAGEDIVKYGVRIGRASRDIEAGEWIHLHNIHSVYDERSSHLDVHTGAPKDIKYE